MSISDFFAQGGYAFYVWGSYGAAAVLIIAELVMLRRHRKELLTRIRRLIRLKSKESFE